MPAVKKSASASAPARADFLVFLLCLAFVLVVLFHKSFESNRILFSNDGPLGAVHSQAGHLWNDLLGCWQPLNWIGSEAPSMSLNVSGLFLALCGDTSPDSGSALFAKTYVPVGLFLLGVASWFLFRQLRFRPWVCVWGGLAAALNTTGFSSACWGLAEWPLSWAMNLFAIAVLMTPTIRNWALKAPLAGLAVGIGVMEGFDVGAIFSLFTAAFAFLRGLTMEDPVGKKVSRSFVVVALMAVCATLIAAQTVSSLVGTQVLGIVGTAQDARTKEARWDFATQSSLPKIETLRVIIPGLFGYRMPELYAEPVDKTGGSNYWGAVGQSPGVLQSRHSGMGFYAGILVALFASFGAAQSFRKKGSPFSLKEQREVWCWLALLIVSLFLAWGRYAPFYGIFYSLPYCSTIRNPSKFMFPFALALVILSGYGLESFCRQYLDKTVARTKSWQEQIKAWWKAAPGFDRKWTRACLVAVAASFLGWLIYVSSKAELLRYLQVAGFPEQTFPQLAESIASFSFHEVGVFILFLSASVVVMILFMSGTLSGRNASVAAWFFGGLLLLDLGRANVPWIVYWNVEQKYASNPVIDRLREKPFEYRVTAEWIPESHRFLLGETAGALYFSEWLQHLFQYYRIQSLDIIQRPREPEFDKAYMNRFAPVINTENGPKVDQSRLYLCARLWQLTNTRYLLGSTNFAELLNNIAAPAQRPFRVIDRFDIVPKPGLLEAMRLEELTAVPAANGQFALIEMTNALPRAKLFRKWQISTNDDATLNRLADPAFDPAQSVLVGGGVPEASSAQSTNTIRDSVEISLYEPKRIRLQAKVDAPAVLMLNDRFHPDWQVRVDGRPETLLRCNYIMRGVYLTPGEHSIEFRFVPSRTAFHVSLAAAIVGLILCGYVATSSMFSRSDPGPSPDTAVPKGRSR